MAHLSLFVPVLIIAMFAKEELWVDATNHQLHWLDTLAGGESVRCWTCSSDLDPMCNDPFYAARADNGYAYNFRLENCDSNSGITYPYLANSKSVCKKQKKYLRGQLVTSRGCAWKRTDDYSSECPNQSNGRDEVTYSCETCEYDGCNGASAIGTTIALLTAPLALLLFK